MKKNKMCSVFAACLLATSLFLTAASCTKGGGSGSVPLKTGDLETIDQLIEFIGISPDGSPEMVRLPGGGFQMESNDSQEWDASLPHTVTLSAFSIGKYEVTQFLYESVMGYNPSYYNSFADSPNYPVEHITWYDAVEFCNKLSEKEGLQLVYAIKGRSPATGYPIESAIVTADWSKNGYRLPTEAQWEYAAKEEFPGEQFHFCHAAWYSSMSNVFHLSAVGTETPNDQGLYDMSGNVWEWCWNSYEETYDTTYKGTGFIPEGPPGVEPNVMPVPPGACRVVRGGGRFADRFYFYPNYRISGIGFRLVRP